MNRKKEGLKKEVIYEVAGAFFAAMTAFVAFAFVSHLWNMDIRVPLPAGDSVGLMNELTAMLRGVRWNSDPTCVAPFSTDRWNVLQDGLLHKAIMLVFTRISNNASASLNLYYILSYPLYALTSYYLLRKSNVGRELSVVGAVLISLIPGHFYRGISHLFVGSSFMVPLAITACIEMMRGEMCSDRFIEDDKLNFIELIKSNSYKQWLGLLFVLLTSFSTIYYGLFTIMMMSFCTLYCCVKTGRLRSLYYYSQYVVVVIIAAMTNYGIWGLAKSRHEVVNADLTEAIMPYYRNTSMVEIYSGKLAQYILPITGHRIKFLADLREIYNSNFLINENGYATFGFFMALGFMAGCIVCVLNICRVNERVLELGRLEIFLFVCSTVGGISSLLGMINYNIRSYNRLSFFIAPIGMIIILTLLQDFFDIKCKACNHITKKVIILFASAVILLVGVFDQTNNDMAYTKAEMAEAQTDYYAKKNFISDIEKVEYKTDTPMILVYPQALDLYQYSTDILWGNIGYGDTWENAWLEWIKGLRADSIVDYARIIGYDGILLNAEPVQLDEDKVTFEELKGGLDERFANGPSLECLDKCYYYSMSELVNDPISSFSDQELNYYRNYLMSDYGMIYNFSTKDMHVWDYNTNNTVGYQNSIPQETCMEVHWKPTLKGDYEVYIEGAQLSGLRISVYDPGWVKEHEEFTILEKTDSIIRISVSYPENIPYGVKYTLTNDTDHEAEVYSLNIYKISNGVSSKSILDKIEIYN